MIKFRYWYYTGKPQLKNNSNKTKHLLAENKLRKLQTFDSSYFRGKNYLVIQPIGW